MGLNDFGESYDFLLDLGIMIVDEDLKYNGHDSNTKHMSVILMIFSRHTSSLRWLYESLLEPGVDKLLYLVMDLMNSSFKKDGQHSDGLSEISFKMLTSIWWFWAKLKVEWRACQRLSISKHGQLLYLTALTTGSLHFLTQFMSSQDFLFLFNISWIFWSKNECLVLLTVFLNFFQSSSLLVNLYFSRSLLQFKFHQLFKYLVILTIFEFFSHIFSMALANELTIFLSESMSVRLLVLIVLIFLIKFLMKNFSSTLPLMIEHFLLWMCSSTICIVTVRGVWSEDSCQSG